MGRKRLPCHYVQMRAHGTMKAQETYCKAGTEWNRHPPQYDFFLCLEGCSSLCPTVLCPANLSSSSRMQIPRPLLHETVPPCVYKAFCPLFWAVIVPKLLASLHLPPPTTEKAITRFLPASYIWCYLQAPRTCIVQPVCQQHGTCQCRSTLPPPPGTFVSPLRVAYMQVLSRHY